MSSAPKPTLRNAAMVVPALFTGLAIGWLVVPSGESAFDYLYSVASPACFGAICVEALLRGGRAASWVPLLLLAVFVLDIARRPHVPVLSALGLAAGAVVGIAALRGHQRTAVAGTVVSCVLLVATLIGGRLLR